MVSDTLYFRFMVDNTQAHRDTDLNIKYFFLSFCYSAFAQNS